MEHSKLITTMLLLNEILSEDNNSEILRVLDLLTNKSVYWLLTKIRHVHNRIDPENVWLISYADSVFFKLFRMKKDTFYHLLHGVMENDQLHLLRKSYRGGNTPVSPEKSLLVFLWYMAVQDTLHSISDRFNLVPSTVMKIVNMPFYCEFQVTVKIYCLAAVTRTI